MNAAEIALLRSNHQRVYAPFPAQPVEIAARFGAMQAQDYNSVCWALGLRCPDASADDVARAFSDRAVVRTWLLRGTLHVAAAANLRWILDLVGAHEVAASSRRYQQLELDDDTIRKSYAVLEAALADNPPLTRDELFSRLVQAGIAASGQRGYHILRRAALEGLICFGVPRGGRETFTLLEAWVMHRERIRRDEALARLADCYFHSHAPASLRDFTQWSGLNAGDARTGLDATRAGLESISMDGELYWWRPSSELTRPPATAVCLLPAFDEYYLGYQSRHVVLDSHFDPRVVSDNGVFRPVVVIDGQVSGIWSANRRRNRLRLLVEPFRAWGAAEQSAVETAAQRYAAFLGNPALDWSARFPVT